MQSHPDPDVESQPATVRARFEALFVDHLLIWFLLFGIALFASVGIVDPTAPTGVMLFSGVLYVPLFLGYKMAAEARTGQTLGKSARDVTVEMTDGSPCTVRAAVVRNLVLVVEWLPWFYLLGLGVVLVRDDGRRLGDVAADTVVTSTTD